MSVFEQSTSTHTDPATPPQRACPGCGSHDADRFYRLTDQPVHVGVTYPTPGQAHHAALGEIDLCYCHACGLVFNAAFDPARLDYTPGYDASMTSSDAFMRFLDAIIDRLIERYQLPGKTVLEIGCGIGHFLRRVCERAGCNGIGIDPAVPAQGREPVGGHTITWVQSMFGPEHAGLPCDLLCGLDMFEHLPEPYAFLRSVRAALPKAGGTPVYFESPNRDHVFDAGAGWSVYYEQCAHYDASTIRGLFERSGFEVTHAGPCALNDQCLSVEAITKPADQTTGQTTGPKTPGRHGPVPAHLAAFGRRQQQRVDAWRERLARWAYTDKDVVLWGSGGKGINFLNNVPGAERIRRVVDVNPARQGRFLPRAGQAIVAPTALLHVPPDIVLVSNPLWHNEIAAALAELGLDCELIDA